MTQQIKQQYSLDQIKKALGKAKYWQIKGGIINSVLASSNPKDNENKKGKTDINALFSDLIAEYGGTTVYIKAGDVSDVNGDPKGSLPTFTVLLPTEDEDSEGETIYVDVIQQKNNNNNQPIQASYVPINKQQDQQVVMHGYPMQPVQQQPLQNLGELIAGFEQTTKNAVEQTRIEFQKQMLEMDYKHKLEDLQRREMDLQTKLGKLEETQAEYNAKLGKLVPDLKDLGGAILNGLFDSAKGLIKKNTLGSSETNTQPTNQTDNNVKLGSKVTVDFGDNKEVKDNVVEMKVDAKPLSKKDQILALLSEVEDTEFNEICGEINKMIDPETEKTEDQINETKNESNTTNDANKDNIND